MFPKIRFLVFEKCLEQIKKLEESQTSKEVSLQKYDRMIAVLTGDSNDRYLKTHIKNKGYRLMNIDLSEIFLKHCQDDIIKRKLLIEGEGGSDDLRITRLLKTFVKWASPSEPEEEMDETYEKMLLMLLHSEHAMEKNLNVYKMNLKEQSKYEALNTRIETEIEKAHDRISESKHDVHQAKRVRRNRQEYDALAKVIQQHPDRQDTLQQLEKLDKELENMKGVNRSLEQQLELRKKQFHVLIAAIHEMQRILEEDEPLEVAEDDDQEVELSMDTT